ncbi:MAG: bifunctional methylenetetrahydrofolate dehydrogenase/methenyltetrahydrofolate cyclohydrolase, partial [Defluviitaleaceae bacterium]|nr:bifunctional methylenetetrahydrofolate dehydrogenase/methenyltetrahydrofolate cyclohydrolase [Defluviitaleaceae bacterium]
MAQLLEGKQVVAALNKQLQADVAQLQTKGIVPTLAIVRVGERGDDISYERGATKRCEAIGVAVKNFVLSSDATQDELLAVIDEVNADTAIHGCLLFRPLPKHMDDNIVRNRLSPAKDVDGITDISLAGVFAGVATGFPPCTPQACMEILDHFNIETAGK